MLKKSDFLGEWQLVRDITDRKLGQSGQLKGTAVFSDVGDDVLQYDEKGEFQLGVGPLMKATRRYQWRFADGGVEMLFADGSAFHSFIPEGYVDGTDHVCGDDNYAVRYDFIPWPKWRVVWVVTGPKKDYTSMTEFVRAEG